MTFYEFSKTRRMARTGGNRVDDKKIEMRVKSARARR